MLYCIITVVGYTLNITIIRGLSGERAEEKLYDNELVANSLKMLVRPEKLWRALDGHLTGL